MRVLAFLAAAGVVASAAVAPYGNSIWGRLIPAAPTKSIISQQQNSTNSSNPFDGKKLTTNLDWIKKIEKTHDAFLARNDVASAQVAQAIQEVGSFVWISDIADVKSLDEAINAARVEASSTGVDQIIGLVLYNLPNRDCSSVQRPGELHGLKGLGRYKDEYITPISEKLAAATDLTFAVVVEPDALANVITNLDIENCADAAGLYEDGIVFAISKLQFSHVHLYLDAAHGGWLGQEGNLEPAAETFARVVGKAGNNTRIRGFSTNVSNYNPFSATIRETWTKLSNSWDENHYTQTLAPHLQKRGLPARFIVDQGRVAENGARYDWRAWCNITPSGFGMVSGTAVNNTLIDSIVWIRAGGESDGKCGMSGAPKAGQWFNDHAEQLVKHAHESVLALTARHFNTAAM